MPIRTFSKNAKEETDKIDFSSGMNQFVWDMNYPPAEKIDNMILWNGNVGTVKAAPGKYMARFRYEKDSMDVPFVIKDNPAYGMTEVDYDNTVSFLLDVKQSFSDIQKAIKRIREVRTQINDFTAKLDTSTTKDVRKEADSINAKLTTIEETLYQTKAKSGQDVLNYPIRLNDKISGIFGVVSSGNTSPSKQAKEAFAELNEQATQQLQKLAGIFSNDLASFNNLIHDKKLPVIGFKQ